MLRLVFVTVSAPVMRKVMDPSAALRGLMYSLSTGKDTPIGNPQKSAGRVKGCPGTNCHLGPRARAGEAVTTPATMPSSAPNATITPSRLMAITSTRGDRPAGSVRRSAGHRLLVPAHRAPVASGLNPAGILLAVIAGTTAEPVVEW